MMNRKIREFGIHPVIAWLLVPVIFTASFLMLFEKSAYGMEICFLSALMVIFRMHDAARDEFLEMSFGSRKLRLIRVMENVMVSLPFVVILLAEGRLPAAAFLIMMVVLVALSAFRVRFSFSLPTPFSAGPFEFPAGFRGTFWVFAIAYVLAVIAVTVDNFNLGIFALILIFLVIYGYYQKPEPEFYIWIFSCSPRGFIFRKLRTALWYSFLISLPVAVLLGVWHFSDAWIAGLTVLLGLLMLVAFVLAKYAAYPREINLPELIFIIMGMVIPPLLLLVIPYFYFRSLRKLSKYLV